MKLESTTSPSRISAAVVFFAALAAVVSTPIVASADSLERRTVALGADHVLQFSPTTDLFDRSVADPRRPRLNIMYIYAEHVTINN